jgi:lysyl-tRNA synthetase, class II
MDLNDLKTRSGLSGKQWDIAMRSLGKQGLTKVTKTDDGLRVEVK